MNHPRTLLNRQQSVTAANEAGPSNQAGPSTQETEDVPMSEAEQGAQPHHGTEQDEDPYYEGHDPLTFGTED